MRREIQGARRCFYETNLSLNKQFNIPIENLKVESPSEFYNIFNHTNLYLPSSGLVARLAAHPTEPRMKHDLRTPHCSVWFEDSH